MFNFIKLKLKLQWGLNRDNNKKTGFLTGFVGLLVIGVLLALVWLLTFVLKANLGSQPKELSLLFLTVLEFALIVLGVTNQINRMYKSGDLAITARFPLTAFKQYLANLVLMFIDTLIYATMLFLPTLIVYGVAYGLFASAGGACLYLLGSILGVIFSAILAFGISTIIAVPVMFILSLLEKHNIVKLIMFVVILAGLFVLYNYVLTVLANYFISKSMTSGTVGVWRSIISALNSQFNPVLYIGNIIFFENALAAVGISLAIAVVFSTIGILIARPVYKLVVLFNLETGGFSVNRRSKIDSYSATRAMIRHSFFDLMHKRVYSYFYLGIAIATPVMVFFCNRLVTLIGQAQIGNTINFGASALVISAFMAMIGSFAASSISVEGKTFYITKITPVGFRRQMLVKGFMHFCVSLGAMLISVIVIAVLKFITPVQMIVLIITEIIFTVGVVFNGLNVNLFNPNLRPKVNGEMDEINVTLMMILGFLISSIIGIGGITLPFAVKDYAAYLIIISVLIVYAAVNIVVFFLTAEKRYARIEI